MRIFLLFIAVGVLISCGSGNGDCTNLRQENDSLRIAMQEIDSVMKSIDGTYDEIESNLAMIEAKKERINQLAQQGKLSQEEKELILLQMDSINLLLNENQEKVVELESKASSQAGKKAGLEHIVESLNDKNSAEGEGIESMKRDLAQISKDFSDLFEDYVYSEAENLEMQEKLTTASSELKEAQEKLQNTKERLYTGWYVVGSKEELKDKGIVYTAGILSNKEVNEDFDKKLFKKVNILDFKEILLNGKRATIITTHPTESYEMQGVKKKVDRLLIKNPEKFWSVSKFLIIEVE